MKFNYRLIFDITVAISFIVLPTYFALFIAAIGMLFIKEWWEGLIIAFFIDTFYFLPGEHWLHGRFGTFIGVGYLLFIVRTLAMRYLLVGYNTKNI